MSAERYKYLVDFVQDHYILGCPVVIEKGALLQDTLNDTVILRLRVRNVSRKTIKYLSILVNMYDDANDPLFDEKPQDFAYLDLSVNQRESFGDNQANILIDANTRKVKIIIEKVVFADETVWRNEDSEVGVSFPEQELLNELEADLLAQFNREFEDSGLSEVPGDLIKYLPQTQKYNWQCTCGFPNGKDEVTCLYCGMDKEWIFKNTEVDLLQRKLDEYTKEQLKLEAKQRIEDERLAEERKVQEDAWKEKNKIRKNKVKKYSMIIVPIVSVIVILLILLPTVIIPTQTYHRAISLFDDGKYIEAQRLFDDLDGYKESKNYIEEIDYILAIDLFEDNKYLEAKNAFNALGDYKEATTYIEKINEKYPKADVCANFKNNIIAAKERTVGLKSDGTVIAVGNNSVGQCDVSTWSDIIKIACIDNVTYGLKWDGTVIATGDIKNIGSVLKWENIVDISADTDHIIGLKSDGTVVADGGDLSGECNVSNWTNITKIYTSYAQSAGIRADGTVVTAGSKSYGNFDTSTWSNIESIALNSNKIVGLKSDGTVVFKSNSEYDKYDVSNWVGIKSVFVGYSIIYGIKADGTVIYTGESNPENYRVRRIPEWTNITNILSLYGGDFALKSNGEISTNSLSDWESWENWEWNDIIAISASTYHIVGLKSDGTVVAEATDKITHGECKISDWSGIAVPAK